MINYPELSDSQLTKLAAKQDEGAFTELIERHRDYIWNVCMKFSDSEHDGEDSRQKALFKAWKALPTFRADCHFKSWMYKIVRNIIYDHSGWKMRRGEISLEGSFYKSGGEAGEGSISENGGDCNVKNASGAFVARSYHSRAGTDVKISSVYEASIEGSPIPNDVLEKDENKKELGKLLEKSLQRLKPNHRECLICLAEGMSYEEIAKLQKVPVGTVMSRVFYARKFAQRYCSHLENFVV